MTLCTHDDVAGSPSASPAEAYAALLRREQQVESMEASLGWRLLSHYGPYKRRYVLPAWRALRQLLGRALGRGEFAAADPYDELAKLGDRLRVLTAPAGGDDDVRVSLVMAIDDSTMLHRERVIASLLAQWHVEWELLVVRVRRNGDEPPSFASPDPRVELDPESHESEAAALTSAIARARGPIVAVLPADVGLPPDALKVVARAFRETAADVVYTDEDHADAAGRRQRPRFLPAWSPELLLSTMYWSRVAYFRREILAESLPLDPALDGALGYACALGATERSIDVVHVPRVLAHVFSTAGASPARAAGELRALEMAVARRDPGARVTSARAGEFRVRYPVAGGRIAIVIPTRDGFAMLRRCLAALERTRHSDFEVIIVDNGSRDEATLALLAGCGHRVLRRPGPFNFSRLNNDAVREVTGRYVLFLNDDTEPTDPDWLTALEEHAQRPEVGAVGARLLYPDGRIQHAGIAVGIGRVAGHPGRFKRDLPLVVRDVSAVTAACLLMRREVFDAVGGFDEALPVNSNDVDLCLRVRARGYRVVYTPHAVLRHYESQTRGARATADDAWLMVRRWRDVLADDPYYNPNLDRHEESGDPDLGKPDGWTCLYPGPPRAEGAVELSPGQSVEQRCYATADGLAAIVVRLTVAGPRPDEAVRLLLGTTSAAEPIRVVERSAIGLRADERWFCFDPIPASRDRFWTFALEVAEGHRVTIRRHPVASDVMGACSENGRPSFGTLQFQLYARAPYRCARS